MLSSIVVALQSEYERIDNELQKLGSRSYLSPGEQNRERDLVVRAEILARAIQQAKDVSWSSHLLARENASELG